MQKSDVMQCQFVLRRSIMFWANTYDDDDDEIKAGADHPELLDRRGCLHCIVW